MITEKQIKKLKKFGYKVFGVVGHKEGTHCFDYYGYEVPKIRSICPAYVAHKGEMKAWEAVLKFHQEEVEGVFI